MARTMVIRDAADGAEAKAETGRPAHVGVDTQAGAARRPRRSSRVNRSRGPGKVEGPGVRRSGATKWCADWHECVRRGGASYLCTRSAHQASHGGGCSLYPTNPLPLSRGTKGVLRTGTPNPATRPRGARGRAGAAAESASSPWKSPSCPSVLREDFPQPTRRRRESSGSIGPSRRRRIS
jgi:hypothetical protein